MSVTAAEYVVPIGGGLGDAILRYLLPGDCGYIADLRRRQPSARVVCRLMSTTPVSAELVAPLFDEVVYERWDGNYRGFLERTRGGHIDRRNLTWERPAIGLRDDERRFASNIGPFVAMHPFAGTPNRDWSTRIDLTALIHAICDAGITLVLLGGSSQRTDGKFGVTQVSDITEQVATERPGLINLVNRGSVRLQAYLATQAQRFIGSFSCYHCAAFATDVPSMVIAGGEMKTFFENSHPVYGTMAARKQTKIHYFGDGDMIAAATLFARGK